MYRKVTRTGPATLTIAIPAKWAKLHDLKAGDEIRIDQTGDRLTISPTQETTKQTIRIPYNEVLFENMLEKIYLQSIPTITVYSEQPIPKSTQRITNKFPGLKIIEEQKNKLVIQQTLRPNMQNDDAIIRRIFILIKQALKSNPPEFPSDISDLLFITRLSQKGSLSHKLLIELTKTIHKFTKPIYDEAHSTLRMLFDLLYEQKYSFTNKNAKTIQNILGKKSKLIEYYIKKENATITSNIYYAFNLIELLHKQIIIEQSVETLSSTQSTSRKRFTVGVCLKNHSNTFWRDGVKGGMTVETQRYKNIDWIFKAPLIYYDLQEQSNIIDEFIEQGVDAIVLAPFHLKKIQSSIKRINNAGIPLIILDTQLGFKADYTYIGWDNYLGGRITAENFKKYIKKKANILIIEGHTEGNFHERVTGFVDTIGKGHNITVKQADFTTSIAYNIALSYLKEKKVDAIYATSDNMAMGCLQACEELEMNIPIAGFDFTLDGENALRGGKLVSSVSTRPQHLGALAVDYTVKILNNKKVPKTTEYDIELKTPKNI